MNLPSDYWRTAEVQRQLLADFLESNNDELIAFRRRLHAQPELSGREHRTTEAIASRLAVAGLSPRVLEGGTGVVCDIPAGPRTSDSGLPTIALRADIDALAMADASTKPYRSTVEGVAHACGHDVHTTILLGAGLLLNRILNREDAPVGRVRLIFEHSEENLPGGAVEIIDDGGMDGVGVIYGLHCDPKLDAGKLGITGGPITSAADLVEIEMTGPGGHTARPELSVDLVRALGLAAVQLPEVMRELTGDGPVKLTFGSARAGDAPNVIPTYARLYGTLRTQDMAIWQDGPNLMRTALATVLSPTGAQWEVTHARGVPPVVNDEQAADFLAQVAAIELGPDATAQAEQSWGGDTFAWYLEKSPGAYIRLGVHDPASRSARLDLHAGTFDVDESAIAIGVRAYVATALSWLVAHQ